MAHVALVHSKRIGARTAPITYTEDGNGCFIWTKTGRIVVKDGAEQGYFNCSGCRSFKVANGGRARIAAVKFNLPLNQWIDSPEDIQHICEPKNINQVIGTNVRRSVQAQIAAGSNEKPSAARVRIDARLISEYHVLEKDFAEIREAAVGSVIATEAALYRAKRKKFPSISTYEEFLQPENQAMWLTLRGAVAKVGEEHYGERLFLYGGRVAAISQHQ